MTTPFSGNIFIGRMGLAIISKYTKFEVSRFTRYEAMNGSAKCRKWGGLGWLRGQSRSRAIPPFDRAHTTSYSTLKKNYVSISYRFLDIAGYLSKVADFDPPHVHLADIGAPVGGHPGRISRRSLLGLSCGVVCVILRLAILVEHRLVTDRQTDRHRASASTADS